MRPVTPSPAGRGVATELLSLPVGLHERVSTEVYFEKALDLCRKSGLDRVAKSPATYRAWATGAIEDSDTPALRIGRALHCATLEPGRFALEYAVQPDFGDCRTKHAKLDRDAWRAENSGKSLLTPEEGGTVLGMARAVREHPTAGSVLDRGVAEATIRFDDPETALACASRVDWYAADLDFCFDLKSTEDASPDAFSRSVLNYRYHVQEAFYRLAFDRIAQPLDGFAFVVVEKPPPHLVAVYTLESRALERGQQDMRANMRTLAACLAADEWPGYPTATQIIGLPPWA